MAKAKKIFVWGASGVGIVLVVLAAVAVLIPVVLDTDAIGRKLATELEARYHIHSERINISFLPFPRMVMHGVRATIPEVLTASVDTVFVHPQILPLFTGRFAPAQIDLQRPMVTARLPEQTSESQAKSFPLGLLRLKDKIFQFQATLLALIPGVVIDSRNGGLELYCGQDRSFFFEEIDLKSSVHAQRVDFELTSGKSNLWQALTFSGWVDLGTLKSSAELNLTGGNPGDLMRYLNASASNSPGDTQMALTLTFSSDGPQSARADFRASIPQFTLDGGPQNPPLPPFEKGGEKNPAPSPHPPLEKGDDWHGIVMSNGALTGALKIDSNGIDFSISHFRFDNPHLSLSANYVERFSDQSVTLNIDGRDTDVDALKSILFTVNKENPVIRRVFDIIRKGEIPEIVFSARANKASDLKNSENFTLKGSIEKGVVYVPKPDLLVSDVSGNVLVEGGVLSATNLSGHTGRSSTSGGELKIGLPKDDPLFHLDLPITADLSGLPDVLKRVVVNQAFRQELAQIKDVEGKVQGRLVLGENIDDLDVRVETGPFQLSGRYGRLPEPVDLQGASFLLEGSKVSVTSLAGKSGNSSFERLNLSYGWGEASFLEISSQGRSLLSMDLLGPTLRSHEYWKNFLDAAPKGSLAVDSLRFTGPLADRSKWVFNASGSVEGVVFQNKQLNGPVTLKTGTFEMDLDQISLGGIEATLADSSLSISGNVTGYLDKVSKIDLQLSGQVGPEGNRIAASIAGFPNSLRAISKLDLKSSHLTWERGQRTAFKGEMELAAGPRIRINLAKTPHGLSIEDLAIKDEDSDATISTDLEQNQVRIGFSGTLSNKTADRLLIDNKLLTGPIVGKFKAHLYLDSPEKSSAQGGVKITGFQLPANLPATARIENAELEADGNKLNVKSALMSWNDSRLSLTGTVAVTGNAYLVDMNALGDTFDLGSILRKSEDGNQRTEEGGSLSSVLGPPEDDLAKPGPQSSKSAWKAPIKGTIRVRTEHLAYGRVSWNPAEAEVVLSPGKIDIRLTQASLCGISTPGNITITPEGLSVSLELSAKDQDLQSALACLFNKKHMLSGSYNLTGNLSAKGGPNGNLVDSLEGEVELKAKDGRIYRFETLGKIISLLAISEIYRGVVPDLIGEGCEYKSIEAKGKIKNGKLVLSDSVMNGPCIKTVFNGEIDFAKQKVDVIALVAPFRTVERVVHATPFMGKVLNEAFVTLPVRIHGDLSAPSVVLLSPSAVGKELFGVMKRVFKLPLAIFQPSPEKGGGHNADSSKQGN